ncbi:flagellar basal body rod protein FlgB [Fredinandcohnia sp. 179-A 10B2 NHS]|uniref:flagellar basal body rod protein FlgB n=1 Tax=Fredinandcohnia sp. 179-A 10B2 NHS TaxID=3235176 RepID=UPI0039A0008F
MKLFSNTINSLERALDFSTLRQKTISNNIANIDTPNFKAKDVSFKNVLAKEVDSQMLANRTSNKHIEFSKSNRVSSQLFTKTDTAYNHNGNNVDIDKEMASLAENQIYYNAVTERISGKFNSLKTVIKGGN